LYKYSAIDFNERKHDKSFAQARPWSGNVEIMKNGNAGSDGVQPGLDHRITYRFSKIAARHARAFSKVYSRKFKLTVNTWMILSVIGRFAPLSANSAGKHSSLEPDKVTRAVDVLVAKGYVVRKQDDKDRRKVALSLSAKGKRVHDELNQLRDIIEHEFLGVLMPAEVAALYRIVDKLEAQAMRLFNDKDVWGMVLQGLAIGADGKAPKRKAKGAIKSAREDAQPSPSQRPSDPRE
jgi:DNA-binding MarR family transcriptional regulator